MTIITRFLAATFLAFAALGSASAQAQIRPTAEPKIVLIRGLMDVFSTGLDDMSNSLRKAGYRDVTVAGWTMSAQIEQSIIAAHRSGQNAPVVLIGHSLGANSAIGIASRLQAANVPVGLLVTFDATEPLAVPGNVARHINIFQQNGVGRATRLAPDFTGEATTIDLTGNPNVTHTNIEKLANMHRLVMDRIAALDLPVKQQARSRRQVSQLN